jgi:hypothetical protein
MEVHCAEPDREAGFEEPRAFLAAGDPDQCEERLISLGEDDDLAN